jgi:hypothetical protein
MNHSKAKLIGFLAISFASLALITTPAAMQQDPQQPAHNPQHQTQNPQAQPTPTPHPSPHSTPHPTAEPTVDPGAQPSPHPYFGYLRRNPNDAPDTNFDGYNFWLNKLNRFNGDFAQAEMVRASIDSSEYRRRFGP